MSIASCVRRDTFGRSLRDDLHDPGVKTDDVLAVDRQTGTALIRVDASGANTIIVVPGANAEAHGA